MVAGILPALLLCGCGLTSNTPDDSTAVDIIETIQDDATVLDAADAYLPGDAVAGDNAGDAATDAADVVEPVPLYINDGAYLRDADGRAIILRGINFPSSDADYWAGKPADQDRTDLEFIAKSGFNAIRLVINWDRIEPEPDTYDADYITLVARHARLADGAGLYVIVDLHQDMYGMGFGLHGAPRWTCDESNYESFSPIEPWFFNYYSTEVSACFDGFWKSLDLQSHHHRAARELAKSLKDIDGVVGFDPHNEPFPGTILFEQFERDYLGPFYDRFGEVVGEVLPGRIVFFEPAVTFSVARDTSFAATESAPAKFFFPHYYNMTVESNLQWDGNAGADRDWVNSAAGQAERLKVPWGLGEMGGNTDTPNLDEFLLSFYDMLDQTHAASFLWLFTRGTGGFGLVDETTDDWKPVAAAFLRPAPSAVAGTPLEYGWDHAARTFTLDWEEDAAAGDTEIILPEWVAAAGYTLTVDGAEVTPPAADDSGRITITGGKGGQHSLSIVVDSAWPGN